MNVDVGGCVRDRRPRHASQGDDEGIRVFRRAALLRTETPPITAKARMCSACPGWGCTPLSARLAAHYRRQMTASDPPGTRSRSRRSRWRVGGRRGDPRRQIERHDAQAPATFAALTPERSPGQLLERQPAFARPRRPGAVAQRSRAPHRRRVPTVDRRARRARTHSLSAIRDHAPVFHRGFESFPSVPARLPFVEPRYPAGRLI